MNLVDYYNYFVNLVKNATNFETKIRIKKVNNINFPRYIIDIIHSKNDARKNYIKFKTEYHKEIYQGLCKAARKEIDNFKKSKFEKSVK